MLLMLLLLLFMEYKIRYNLFLLVQVIPSHKYCMNMVLISKFTEIWIFEIQDLNVT
jgi:hypothetical protein